MEDTFEHAKAIEKHGKLIDEMKKYKWERREITGIPSPPSPPKVHTIKGNKFCWNWFWTGIDRFLQIYAAVCAVAMTILLWGEALGIFHLSLHSH